MTESLLCSIITDRILLCSIITSILHVLKYLNIPNITFYPASFPPSLAIQSSLSLIMHWSIFMQNFLNCLFWWNLIGEMNWNYINLRRDWCRPWGQHPCYVDQHVVLSMHQILGKNYDLSKQWQMEIPRNSNYPKCRQLIFLLVLISDI